MEWKKISNLSEFEMWYQILIYDAPEYVGE